jgi:hypothetical protein
MNSIPDQIRRRGERALHNAALAIQRGDFEAKKKYLDLVEFYRNRLREAGEPDLEPVMDPDAIERCDQTEDLFQ